MLLDDGVTSSRYRVTTIPHIVLIDRDGVVQHVFNSQLNVRKHVREALDVVKRLSA